MSSFIEILEAFENKENILLLGPGGTGKSILLRLLYHIGREVKTEECPICMEPTVEIIPCKGQHRAHRSCVTKFTLSNKLDRSSCPICRETLEDNWENIKLPENTFITATTGIASYSINGCTIHHWSGIQTGTDKPQYYVIKNTNRDTGRNIRNCKILIIDEISMLGKNLFDKLDLIFKIMRDKYERPFGGMQVILSGDFLQLPPIHDDWVFESKNWNSFNFLPFILEKSRRYQSSSFYEMLLRIRKGSPTKADISTLESRFDAYVELKKNYSKIDIKPTIIYSKKINVEEHNSKELKKCPGPNYYFYASDTIKNMEQEYERKLSKKIAAGFEARLEDAIPGVIILRVGAQVMLKANLNVEMGLVNGSRGVVTDIVSEPPSIKVKFMNGNIYTIERFEWDCSDREKRIKAKRFQVPLILAWSLTIHKTQSCTLDSIICDLGPSIFECGQAYVALSRARTLEGLYLSQFARRSIKVNKKALEFCKSQEKIQNEREITEYNIEDEDGTPLTDEETLQLYLKKYNIL